MDCNYLWLSRKYDIEEDMFISRKSKRSKYFVQYTIIRLIRLRLIRGFSVYAQCIISGRIVSYATIFLFSRFHAHAVRNVKIANSYTIMCHLGDKYCMSQFETNVACVLYFPPPTWLQSNYVDALFEHREMLYRRKCVAHVISGWNSEFGSVILQLEIPDLREPRRICPIMLSIVHF